MEGLLSCVSSHLNTTSPVVNADLLEGITVTLQGALDFFFIYRAKFYTPPLGCMKESARIRLLPLEASKKNTHPSSPEKALLAKKWGRGGGYNFSPVHCSHRFLMLLITMQLPNRIPFGNVLKFAATTITRKSLRLIFRCHDCHNKWYTPPPKLLHIQVAETYFM